MASGSYDTIVDNRLGNICSLRYGWTSDASAGTVTQTDSEAKTAGIPAITGTLLRVITIPDSDTTQPDNLYDITLLESNGFDLLGAAGANRSESNTEALVIARFPFVQERLRMQGSAMGNSNGGTIEIIYERGD